MIPRTWEDCRSLWEVSEYRLLLSPEQIAARWADGRCGQCGLSYDDHATPTPVSTADAVMATPFPPVDPLVVGYLRGTAIRSQLGEDQWQKLCALVHLIPDDYPVRSGDVLAGGAL